MLQVARVIVSWRRWAVMVVCVTLVGCQMDLHTKLKEPDANEILGALLAANIDASKLTPDGGKSWTISVEKSQAVRAIEVLRLNALPRQRHDSLGDLFKKEGMISSPTEERVRFIFGIEQALAQTVAAIDGVMVARVHIVLPNNDPLASLVKPSSASVFVKHRREADLISLVPSIKNLVVHAVEGLSYEQVTITMVAASAEIASFVPTHDAPPASLGIESGRFWLLGLGLGLVGVLGALTVVAFKRGWLSKAAV